MSGRETNAMGGPGAARSRVAAKGLHRPEIGVWLLSFGPDPALNPRATCP